MNWKLFGIETCSLQFPPKETSFETYPYPKAKREHNGAVGPKYAYLINDVIWPHLLKLMLKICYWHLQAKEHQRNGSILIDVREPVELRAHGVVPGAINIPVGYINEGGRTFQPQNFQPIPSAWSKVHSDAFWPFLVHWGLDKPLLKIQRGHIK